MRRTGVFRPDLPQPPAGDAAGPGRARQTRRARPAGLWLHRAAAESPQPRGRCKAPNHRVRLPHTQRANAGKGPRQKPGQGSNGVRQDPAHAGATRTPRRALQEPIGCGVALTTLSWRSRPRMRGRLRAPHPRWAPRGTRPGTAPSRAASPRPGPG